jgi:hypothetical protein
MMRHTLGDWGSRVRISALRPTLSRKLAPQKNPLGNAPANTRQGPRKGRAGKWTSMNSARWRGSTHPRH